MRWILNKSDLLGIDWPVVAIIVLTVGGAVLTGTASVDERRRTDTVVIEITCPRAIEQACRRAADAAAAEIGKEGRR